LGLYNRFVEEMEKKNWKATVATLRWIIKLYWKMVPNTLLLVLGLQIAIALLPIVETRFFSTFLDDLILFFQNDSTAWKKSLIALFVVAVISRMGQNVIWICRRIFDLEATNKLKKLYLSKVASLDYQQLEDVKTTSLMAKVRDDYRWRSEQVMRDIIVLIAQAFNLTAVLIILVQRYWYLAIILLLGQIPKQVVSKKWIEKGWCNFNKNIKKNRLGWAIHSDLTDKKYLAELKINKAIPFLKDKYDQLVDDISVEMTGLHKNRIRYNLLSSLVSFFVVGICLVVVAKDIRSGWISIGMFTFYYGVIQRTGGAFSSAFSRWMNISEQISYIGYFKQVMELETKIVDGRKRLKGRKVPLIELRNVSFRYPGAKRWVLKNFNLKIKPREEIALVGANGAGKSTIIKLLCRFYNPTLGEVYINGRNLKEVKIEDWYGRLGILFQEYNIYQNLSLKDNVIIGDTRSRKKEKVLLSLKRAQVSSLVTQYKMGLETIMGRRYGGEEPSWGQWQKIAIARVLHKNAPVLVLDEPTSSIDAISESKIFNRIYKENISNTVLIVSHRFSTVRKAQRILVIDKGKIIEEGSHDVLMERRGIYFKSFSLQAKGYGKNG